jgi:hypothetical protein
MSKHPNKRLLESLLSMMEEWKSPMKHPDTPQLACWLSMKVGMNIADKVSKHLSA